MSISIQRFSPTVRRYMMSQASLFPRDDSPERLVVLRSDFYILVSDALVREFPHRFGRDGYWKPARGYLLEDVSPRDMSDTVSVY
jgi:hypothetical protein